MNYGDHNFIEITQQTKLRVALVVSSQSRSTYRARRASRARHVERVELCCSTMSTQPKWMGSTRRTCRVVSSRVQSSQVEFGLNLTRCRAVISKANLVVRIKLSFGFSKTDTFKILLVNWSSNYIMSVKFLQRDSQSLLYFSLSDRYTAQETMGTAHSVRRLPTKSWSSHLHATSCILSFIRDFHCAANVRRLATVNEWRLSSN